MRTFDPWIGNRYATDGIRGKRLLILGESHYGKPDDQYLGFTSKVISDEALKKGSFAIYAKILRLVMGTNAGLSNEERADFWQRVAFCNFIQTILVGTAYRPTDKMWNEAREPLLQTLREITPTIVLVLGFAVRDHLPPMPAGIPICAIRHPSRGCSYVKWQPVILSALAASP